MQTGDVHFSSKNYVEAERIYRALLDQNAKDSDALYSLGQALRAQDKHAPAADALVRSVEDSKNPMAGYTLYAAAIEYAKAGRKEDAITALEKVFSTGYSNRNLAAEPALASIASDPRVRQLLAKK